MPYREPKRRREPRPVGELIEGLSRKAGWAERLALGTLRERWPEVVGPAVASRCEPVRLDQAVLTIRAEAGAWATELTLLGASVAAKSERLLGPGSVREVRVVAGRRGASESPR